MKLLHGELTDIIIKTFYEVYNELEHGFLERVLSKFLVFGIEKQRT
jgi:hypothetical protein